MNYVEGKEVSSLRKGTFEPTDENKENAPSICEMNSIKALPPRDSSARDSANVQKKVPSSLTFSSTPLSPAVEEEFNFSPYVTSVPTTSYVATMFSPHSLSMIPPFSPYFPPPSPLIRQHQPPPISAVVELPGFINLKLRHDMVLSISANMAIRLKNLQKQSSISLSSCSTQMAIVHPKGRILQYGIRVEAQVEDTISVKNAKIFPRGISFTANNMALVYLLDEAGARSTSDMFHDLHATDIAETVFNESLEGQVDGVNTSIRLLDTARYWRTRNSVDCWIIGPIFIQQTEDGMVVIEKDVEQGKKIFLRSSPSNGKVKADTHFVQVTASLGTESHMFLRSLNRRLHYSGQSKVFTVRNAGHSAGFDEEGSLRIF